LKHKEARALKQRKELVVIVGGASQKNASKLMSGKKKESKSQWLLSVERGKELVVIVGGASQKSTSKLMSGKKKESKSQRLLSVERGKGRGNWFQDFGVALHRRTTT